MSRAATVLMFEGRAEEALGLYAQVFEDVTIERIERWPDGEAAGRIKRADWRLGGHRLIAFDSPIPHAFGFTPAVSVWVDWDSAEALERAFARLSEGGQVLMPLDAYDFSARFGWCNDRFGVSWQLGLR